MNINTNSPLQFNASTGKAPQVQFGGLMDSLKDLAGSLGKDKYEKQIDKKKKERAQKEKEANKGNVDNTNRNNRSDRVMKSGTPDMIRRHLATLDDEELEIEANLLQEKIDRNKEVIKNWEEKMDGLTYDIEKLESEVASASNDADYDAKESELNSKLEEEKSAKIRYYQVQQKFEDFIQKSVTTSRLINEELERRQGGTASGPDGSDQQEGLDDDFSIVD